MVLLDSTSKSKFYEKKSAAEAKVFNTKAPKYLIFEINIMLKNM